MHLLWKNLLRNCMSSLLKNSKHVHDENSTSDEHVFITKNLKEKKHTQSALPDKDHISENLTAIYENKDGSFPDMKNFEKRNRTKLVRIFFHIVGIGLLSLVLALCIIYFSAQQNQQGNDFILSVSSVQKVKIGDSIDFSIDYENPESVSLSQAVLTVHYPENFSFKKSSLPSTNDTHTEWKLGTLAPGAKGRLIISGEVFGSLNQEQSLRAFLNYIPGNFSSEFQKVATVSFSFEKSPIDILLKAPNQVSVGATVPLDLMVVKNSDFELASFSLVMDSANNTFTKKSSQPQSEQVSDFSWALDTKSVTSTVRIQGAFLSHMDSNASSTPIIFKVVGYVNAQKIGTPLVLGEISYSPQLMHTALESKVFVNSIVSEGMVAPGENLNTSVVLKNTGDQPIKNIELSLTFEAPSIGRQSILDWNKIEDRNDGNLVGKSIDDTRRQGVLTWTGKQISDLVSIAPGKEVRVDILVPIKNNSEDAEQYTSWNILVNSETKYEIEKEKKTVNSNTVDLLLQSDLTLEVESEVSGDTSKTYDITWLLKNSYHPLKDIEISVDVYGDVIFDESKLIVPAGKVTFDNTKKSLTWNIAQMPREVDVNALQFSLLMKTPNPSQKQLTSKVKIRAFDIVTQKEILFAGDEVLVNAVE